MAMTARMPMIATTIISSTRVKPEHRLLRLCSPVFMYFLRLRPGLRLRAADYAIKRMEPDLDAQIRPPPRAARKGLRGATAGTAVSAGGSFLATNLLRRALLLPLAASGPARGLVAAFAGTGYAATEYGVPLAPRGEGQARLLFGLVDATGQAAAGVVRIPLAAQHLQAGLPASVQSGALQGMLPAPAGERPPVAAQLFAAAVGAGEGAAGDGLALATG